MPEEAKLIQVNEVVESWHAPGYRDPEQHFKTDAGEFRFRLTPKAFVHLHNTLCEQQSMIDAPGFKPLDLAAYPQTTFYVATRRPAGINPAD